MHTQPNTRKRFILVGSAIALCCVPIHIARGQGGGGEGLLIQGVTIQDNIFLNNMSPVAGVAGGAGGTNGGIGLHVNSSQINGFTLMNSAPGSIMGGPGLIQNGSGGDGVRFSAGFDFTGAGTITGVMIDHKANMIAGADGVEGGGGGHGIHLRATDTINMVTINNVAAIKGGKGGTFLDGFEGFAGGGAGGHGILISGNGNVTNVWFNNHNLILGGPGGNGPDAGGMGGNGISVLSSQSDPSFVTTMNMGSILGAAGGIATMSGSGGGGGDGIAFQAGTDIGTVTLLNAPNAVVRGGAGGKGVGGGGTGGTGYRLSAGSGGRAMGTFLRNVLVDNGGTIAGADGGHAGYSTAMVGNGSGSGGFAGHGIFLQGNGIDMVTIHNRATGAILGAEGGYGNNGGSGGRGGDGLRLDGHEGGTRNIWVNNLARMAGGEGGDNGGGSGRGGDGGDAIRANNFSGPINGFNIYNAENASMIGGDGGGGDGDDDFGGGGGHGITMFAPDIKNGTITNLSRIIGGNGGSATGSFSIGGSGGVGIDLTALSVATLANILITNADTGVVQGGNAGTGSAGTGANGGDAIFLGVPSFGPPASTNVRVVNFGLLQGGAAFGTGTPGAGIMASGNHGGVTIDNWGTIAAGAGMNPVAISITGSNNVINLNGHSSVFGKINGVNGAGSANTNVINLNFTGVPPAVQAALAAQLAAQGVVPGVDANFTFTLRGVTYVIDPLVINLAPKSYQLQGLSGNQQSLGASLDGFTVNPTGDMLRLLNAVDLSGNVPLALDALSPQRYQIFSDIALANANLTALEIAARLNNRRNGSEAIDASQFRVGSSSIEHQLGLSGRLARGRTVAPLGTVGVSVSKSDEKRWGGFISGTAVFGDIGGRPGLGDAEFTTAGFLLGVDGKVNDSLVAGVLLGYHNTDSDLDGIGSQADVEAVSTGLYAGWNQGPYYANALATYSHNDYDSRRAVLFPGVARTATSNTDGDQFALNIDGGYDYIVNDQLTIGPIAGLQYVHLDVGGFAETGAGAANLVVGGQDVDSLRSRLGVRVNYRKTFNQSWAMAADFRAAWQHEFLDDSRAITGTFANSGLAPFAVQTSRPGRNAALLGLGVNVTYREYLTFFLDYDAQVGASSDVLQSLRGGVKAAF